MAHDSGPSAPPYIDALRGFHEDGASASQEEAIFSDVLTAQLQEEERFEDRFDADFIEEQRLLLNQYEDMKHREVGNFEKEFGAPAAVQAPCSLESQPSLFPSDLPATLDGVVQAVVAAEHDAARSRRTSSSTQRSSLPPTLSNVQKALHDMRSGTEDGESFHGDAAPRHPPARTASYDEFVIKFTQHFKLDCN